MTCPPHPQTHSLSLPLTRTNLHNMKPLHLLLFFLLTTTTATATLSQTPNDAVSLLSFKSKADLDNKLLFTLHERFDYCQWQGVKCSSTGRVIRLVLPNSGLRGTIFLSSLTNLDQLRVLSLRNNSLYGPLPDFSSLLNLKSLFLSYNYFTGSFPVPVLCLHRLTVLDLSFNRFEGFIPSNLSSLDRLTTLLLQSNQFNGTLPPLNLPLLLRFNVSGNKLSGNVPATPTLARFDSSAFSLNPELCGELINKACKSRSPFFGGPSSNAASPNAPLGQQAISTESGGDTRGGVVTQPRKHKRSIVIVGFAVGVSVLIASILCIVFVCVYNNSGRKETRSLIDKQKHPESQHTAAEDDQVRGGEIITANAKSQEVTDVDYQQVRRSAKSGSLVFCGVSGESHIYTLEQLMRASAELLGRGTIGTTYKALLDNQLIVTVKRVDATKTALISSEAFERHMDTVGALRHPNLVPIMAYFQAKGERLVIYEYQPNGSLFNLIHGSRSTRAKPLHWTSCLKIAEDVAQGLAYIHQSSKLVHGNLKSTNVLLGADFEACITDYSLATLSDTCSEDPDSTVCKAPEARRSNLQATTKSDVYAFGVLLLELLTGKHPSQHPYLVPTDLFDWVRAVRDDDNGDDNQLGMLVEVASVCSLTSPEQRPSICQVLSMIQEIKESVIIENNAAPGH